MSATVVSVDVRNYFLYSVPLQHFLRHCHCSLKLRPYGGIEMCILLLLLLSMQKTFQFKTQCKGDISHAFETAKITVFYPTVCKTPDVPLQNELLC